eukprot:TsM_000350200 transcript=TsM_000350200 gene=TsM_000350200
MIGAYEAIGCVEVTRGFSLLNWCFQFKVFFCAQPLRGYSDGHLPLESFEVGRSIGTATWLILALVTSKQLLRAHNFESSGFHPSGQSKELLAQGRYVALKNVHDLTIKERVLALPAEKGTNTTQITQSASIAVKACCSHSTNTGKKQHPPESERDARKASYTHSKRRSSIVKPRRELSKPPSFSKMLQRGHIHHESESTEI